ncbi:SURF1 family protein [Actinotalea subterranea]|uniref:SURF1 family protein n=1 Tax=Actinotalea subterranea TaxID=2607497 RepID=UPI0011EF8DA3|nr:SURF1 family protein [Actinotalea subterranea]
MRTSAPVLRRAATTVLVALVVAGACAAAGVWQWDRHVARSAQVALVEANYDADAVPLADVLTPSGPRAQDVWRTAVVVGTYLEPTVLLRNRPVDGHGAFHVLAGLLVQEGPLAGSVLVVDRGWLPVGQDGSGPARDAATPGGTVTVVVRLRPSEPESARAAPAGQVQAIAPAQVRDAVLDARATSASQAARDDDPPTDGASGTGWPRGSTLAGYGVVATEGGEPPADVGPLPRPGTSLGSHLSYAFQWWVFALGALVGAVVLVRRDVTEERREADPEDDPPAGPQGPGGDAGGPGGGAGGPGGDSDAHGPQGSRARATVAGRRRRRPTAEEEEDAILDAQLS